MKLMWRSLIDRPQILAVECNEEAIQPINKSRTLIAKIGVDTAENEPCQSFSEMGGGPKWQFPGSSGWHRLAQAATLGPYLLDGGNRSLLRLSATILDPAF